MKKGQPAEGKEYGPGWLDVCRFVDDLERQYGKRSVFRTTCLARRDGTWGFRVTATCEAYPEAEGYGVYGPLYPGNGQKTMAAAYWHALFQLDVALAKAHALAQMELPF